MIWVRRSALSLVVLLSTAQCSRAPELLYLLPDKPADRRVITSKIKEAIGNNRVDILWIIDNSGSMSMHQKNVILNTDKFMNAFTKKRTLDWKMGLISTHIGDKPFTGFKKGDELDASSADPMKQFQKAVADLGLNKGCPEVVFQPVMDALDAYPNFVRPNSFFVMIALTDTMEEVAGMQAKFETYLSKVKPNIHDLRFFGTFAGKSFKCESGEPVWEYPKSPFEYFINLTGAEVYDLCDADFGDNLAEIGEAISKLAESSKIFLAERPKVDTLTVSFKGQLLQGGQAADRGLWLYDFNRNAIIFHNLDFAGDDQNAEVEISFEKSTL